ncbi:MAG: choice-of-anchor Q domain-containing protein [Thermoanaerobaculia bacterium]
MSPNRGEFRRILVGLALAGATHVAGAAAQVTYQVDSTLDQIDDDLLDGACHTAAGTCTLRAATMQANLVTGPGVTILLPAGTYTLTRPIVGANGPDSGDLNLTTAPLGGTVISIVGAGATTTILSANQQYRILDIAPGREASLSRLTITGGTDEVEGGGIRNGGFLSLYACRITQNEAFNGGGIYNFEFLSLVDSIVDGNITTGGDGGGILSNLGEVRLARSTIHGNFAWRDGGGLAVYQESLTATNSTISGNSTNRNAGGVLYVSNVGSANLYNVSIVLNGADEDGNFVGSGGGAYVAPGSVFSIRNSLIAVNHLHGAPVYEDCSGAIGSYGRNLVGTADGCTINIGSGSWGYFTPFSSLGPLANNGGSTRTHAILPGSSALDAGDPVLGCIDQNGAIPSDQRGAPRIFGAACDIGAYEAGILFFDSFESGDTSSWSL